MSKFDVFISHSRKDKTSADAVCAVLEQHHLRCWVAPRDIPPGAEWGAAIMTGIESSRVMVLVFSRNANGSRPVRCEVERALNKNLVIVPFRIEDAMPTESLELFLSGTHWLDPFTPPHQRHLDALAARISGILGRELIKPDLPSRDFLRAPRIRAPDQDEAPPFSASRETLPQHQISPVAEMMTLLPQSSAGSSSSRVASDANPEGPSLREAREAQPCEIISPGMVRLGDHLQEVSALEWVS